MRSMFWADHATNTRPLVWRNKASKSASRSLSVMLGLSVPRLVPSISRMSMPVGGEAIKERTSRDLRPWLRKSPE